MVKPGSVVRMNDKGWAYLGLGARNRMRRDDLWVVCEVSCVGLTVVRCRRMVEPSDDHLLFLHEIEEVELCDTARET